MHRRSPWSLVRIAVATVALGSAVSCTSIEEHDVRVVPSGTIVPFLAEGRSTRSELIERLGEPQRQLEAGRILIWELDDNGTPQAWRVGQMRPGGVDLSPSNFHLVAVTAGERVERTSLVRVRR